MTNTTWRRLGIGTACLLMVGLTACGDDSNPADAGDTGDADDAGADGDADVPDGPACTTAAECDDDNPCTTDRCLPTGCTNTVAPDGTACGGDPCFDALRCEAGACVAGTPNLDADDDGYNTVLCGGDDCDDADPLANPGMTEGDGDTCTDGRDNDCDGNADALDVECSGRVCVGDGWCFENPLPHSLAHAAVWPISADEIWAGGNGVVHWSDGDATWQSLPSTYPAISISGMWASGPDDVWAVGQGVWHFDGTSWAQDTTLPFSMPSDVCGTGPTNVLVAGSGAIHQWNGSGWRPLLTGAGETFRSLWAVAPDDVWAGSYNGTLTHWDGTSWTSYPSGTTAQILALWGAASDDVWAAIAEAGALLHWNGTAWSRVDTGFTALIGDLAGTATDDAWAVAGPMILHWDGSVWVAVSSGVTQALTAIRAHGSTVVAAGDGGLILRRSGTTWERLAPTGPVPAAFNDLWATGSGATIEAFAVGTGGAIARRQADASWVAEASPVTLDLTAVAGAAADDVWAVGSAAGFVHWNGTAWSTHAAPSGSAPVDLCANASDELWAVGARLLGYDGTTWAPDPFQPGYALERVFCTGGGEAWAWGRERWYEDTWQMFQRTGDAWGPVGPGALWEWIITDGWGSAVDDLWIVSHQTGRSRLLHWNGGIWRPVEPETAVELYGVGGTAANDVWFVGAGGAALHWNGTAFAAHDVTTTERLIRVYGFSATDAIAAGDHGGLYRWDGTNWGVLAPAGTTAFGDVWVAGPGAAWATTGSRLQHWDGTAWTQVTSASIYSTASVFGFSADDVWVAEEYGGFWHWDGTTWTEYDPSTIGSYQTLDFWGRAPNDLWAVDEDGELQHWNGSAWVAGGELDTHLDPGYGGVLVGGGDEVWHVTQDFFDDTTLAFRYDGRAWGPYATLTQPVAMGGPAADDQTAIDNVGAVWHWDGVGWSVVEPAPEDARGVRAGWVFGADDAWVVNLISGPAHWNGSAWTDVGAAGVVGFTTFGGAPDGTLWGLGTNGAILRRRR